MEVLKDYPKEFGKAFAPSFKLLSKINIKYLNNNMSWAGGKWKFLIIVPTAVIFWVSMAIAVCRLVMGGDIFEIAYRMPPFLVTIQAIFKAAFLFPKTEQISHIIKELGALWRTTGLNRKQVSERNSLLKRLNLCNGATYWITTIGTSQYFLSPLLETLLYKIVLQQDSEMLLPVTNAFPFDPRANWLVYLSTYVFQTYSMMLCVVTYAGTELIMITLCAVLGLEFTLLCEDLQQVRPPQTNANVEIERLPTEPNYTRRQTFSIEEFVRRHQKLIELSSLLDNVFNQIILINLLFVGITTCFFHYAGQFSRGPTYMINNYMAVCSSMLYVLYMCYYGELLTSGSLRIGEAAYNSVWYIGDKRYQTIICIIIKRSQSACCLTSMKYTPVTLNMFTKVMSTTWSYFSLMNNIYEE